MFTFWKKKPDTLESIWEDMSNLHSSYYGGTDFFINPFEAKLSVRSTNAGWVKKLTTQKKIFLDELMDALDAKAKAKDNDKSYTDCIAETISKFTDLYINNTCKPGLEMTRDDQWTREEARPYILRVTGEDRQRGRVFDLLTRLRKLDIEPNITADRAAANVVLSSI